MDAGGDRAGGGGGYVDGGMLRGGCDSSSGCAVVSTGARGGPLLMPGFVSPLAALTQFRDSCLALLQKLQNELDDLPFSIEDSDISVDDLKIASDDELVMKALEEKEGLLQGNHTPMKSLNPTNDFVTNEFLDGESLMAVLTEMSCIGGRQPSSNEPASPVQNKTTVMPSQSFQQENDSSTKSDRILDLGELLENSQSFVESLKGNASFVDESDRTNDFNLASISDDFGENILLGVPGEHIEINSDKPDARTPDIECGNTKEQGLLQGKHTSERSLNHACLISEIAEGENLTAVFTEVSFIGGREPSSNDPAVSTQSMVARSQVSEQEKDMSIKNAQNLGVDEMPESSQSFVESLKGNAGFVEEGDRTKETNLASISDDYGQNILLGFPGEHIEVNSEIPAPRILDIECRNTKAQEDAEILKDCKTKRRKKGPEGRMKKKRGKPFDRDLRAAELEMNGCLITEEHLDILKKEREVAKSNAPLLSLRMKLENEGSSASTTQIKKLGALMFLTSTLKADSVAIEKLEPVPDNEIVLCIEFYNPIRKHQKIQEFLVLGSQPVTALRDKLYCLTDVLMQKAHMYSPSGYFLIEDTFYNDMRDPKATDYSSHIMSWFKQQDEAMEKWKSIGGTEFQTKAEAGLSNSFSMRGKLPSFKVADMSSTQFLDLHCRIGVQYLYCHQGDCKHILVIRDIRLIHKDDVQNMLSYPLLRFQTRLRHRKCSICDIYKARKVAYGDKMAPSSPCFFCEHCYYLLHYSKEGILLYSDFNVYDYYHE